MLLNLDGAFDEKICVKCSRYRLLLAEKNHLPKYGHNGFKTVTTDRCPAFFMIAATEKEASVFVYLGFQLYALYTAAEMRALTEKI